MTDDLRLTPMMRQYHEAKQTLPPDTVLFYRLGDFYELFFEDAHRVAPILDLVLTHRAGSAMCGIPYHAVDAYLPKLLEAGLKVAIAEQMEDPKLAKGLVKRQITRIITPGTPIDAALLTSDAHTYFMAFCIKKERMGTAVLDLSTADFQMADWADVDDLAAEVARTAPRELVIPESLNALWRDNPEQRPPCLNTMLVTALPDFVFSSDYAQTLLMRHFKVQSLESFGAAEAPIGTLCAGAALYYVSEHLKQRAVHVQNLACAQPKSYMVIDSATLRHLELLDPLPGHARNNTLVYHLNQSCTPMGSRLLREWLLHPLCDVAQIEQRQGAIQCFVDDPALLAELREMLGAVRDLERITARINLGSVTARDFLALTRSLAALPEIISLLNSAHLPPLLEILSASIDCCVELQKKVEAAIVDEPPAVLTEGGFIKSHYNEHLDQLRSAATNGKQTLAQIQLNEQQKTGIKNLKVQYNRVFGYYIEVSKSNLSRVPETYTRKQTLVNCERFITPELKEYEKLILGAEEKAIALEQELFSQLRDFALPFTTPLQKTARALATLDTLGALAYCAQRYRYIRPQVSDEVILDIKAGRHPILDITLQQERFVPNDILLNDDDQRIMIITGPNMAGKSTYIRQTALLVLMAQCGSFIPAEAARIGIADRLFTRIGASDDISRGLSTFMVEMIETATILRHATPKSLVILDEIGRGTSTFDGLAIAWAVTEYLHDHPAARARTLFATHYHELTELSVICPGVKNFNVAVKEYGDQIIFLRQIVPGPADKSYGIQVARLAGLPRHVIRRAFEILDNLERHAFSNSGTPSIAENSNAYRANESGTAYETAADKPARKSKRRTLEMPPLPPRRTDLQTPLDDRELFIQSTFDF